MHTGAIAHSLYIDNIIEELYDVVVLPRVRLPRAVGFQDDDIGRLLSFPESEGLVITKPAVKHPGPGKQVRTAGLPAPAYKPGESSEAVKYQRVYHLNAGNLVPYEAMTYPSLQNRWQTQPQRGELLGVSASAAGEIVGLAVAELFNDATEPAAELLSLYVLPAHRNQGIGTNLTHYLQQFVGRQLDRRPVNPST
jgi:hypothetical protein